MLSQYFQGLWNVGWDCQWDKQWSSSYSSIKTLPQTHSSNEIKTCQMKPQQFITPTKKRIVCDWIFVHREVLLEKSNRDISIKRGRWQIWSVFNLKLLSVAIWTKWTITHLLKTSSIFHAPFYNVPRCPPLPLYLFPQASAEIDERVWQFNFSPHSLVHSSHPRPQSSHLARSSLWLLQPVVPRPLTRHVIFSGAPPSSLTGCEPKYNKTIQGCPIILVSQGLLQLHPSPTLCYQVSARCFPAVMLMFSVAAFLNFFPYLQ